MTNRIQEDSFDNWQDTYGMDAVKVFYHSGHGGMGNDGVFGAPTGAKLTDSQLVCCLIIS